MSEPAEIADELEAFFQPKRLAGKRVVVTAGPTEEPLDPVRMLTNASSGKMGYAVARAAREAGAEVILVSGPVALTAPQGVSRVKVRTAQEMFEAVKKALAGCDVFVSVAAVADYRVKSPAAQKIKKGSQKAVSLELEENPDILAWVASQPKPPFCVGFAAETENLAAYAAEKRARKKLPLLAANLAQEALGREDNTLLLFDEKGQHSLGQGPKIELARKLMSHVAGMLGELGR
jgi:phosphopantothenoylcysteine decarboxylase/phosphopantothenate--cysteine ligase